MKFIQSIFSLVISTNALAVPTGTLQERSTTICGQWDSVVTGTYTVWEASALGQETNY